MGKRKITNKGKLNVVAEWKRFLGLAVRMLGAERIK
jgi:hypothetical protein